MITVAKSRIEPKPREHPKQVGVVAQGQIGVSTSGQTNLFSYNFCGCQALLIASMQGFGGLLAHIAETGQIPGNSRDDYIRQSIDLVLGLAIKLFPPKVHVALFRGWQQEIARDWGLGNDNRVGSFLDLRARSYQGEHTAVFFDTVKKKVYMSKDAIIDIGRADHEAMFERSEAMAKSGTTSLEVPLAAKTKMLILTFP
jgi:hypothetical protein